MNRQSNKLIWFVLLFVLSLSVSWSQDTLKTTKSDSLEQESFLSEVFFETRSTTKKIVAWPFENIIEPTLSLAIYPISPPINYVFRKDIIDRGLAFSSFGVENNVFIYPTMSIGSGVESSLGLGYVHRSLFFPGEDRARIDFYRTIDDDWFQRIEYQKRNSFGFRAFYALSATRNSFKNTNSYPVASQLDSAWLRADSSVILRANLGFPIGNRWSTFVQAQMNFNNFNTPQEYQAIRVPNAELYDELEPLINRHNQVYDDFKERGFWAKYRSYPLTLGFIRNTKENQFASTGGYRFRGFFNHTHVGSGFGDLQSTGFSLEHYTLLGDKPYALTAEEHKAKKRYLRNFRLNDALDLFTSDQWREIYLQQKVLVTFIEFRQAWDFENDQPAIYDALSTVGKNSPLRAYPTRRFVDYGSLTWSTEYRWPLIQYLDGVFFNEYGWVFKDPSQFDFLSLKNSWGFGVRARKPEFFIMRFSLGFHGPIIDKRPIEDVLVRVTIRPEF